MSRSRTARILSIALLAQQIDQPVMVDLEFFQSGHQVLGNDLLQTHASVALPADEGERIRNVIALGHDFFRL